MMLRPVRARYLLSRGDMLYVKYKAFAKNIDRKL